MTENQQALLALAPAKINWTLDILERRPDGYHEIESIMQTISLPDYVVLSLTDAPGVDLKIAGPMAPGVPSGPANTAYRAAAAILDAAGAVGKGLHVELTKLIPIQAGLGGGSSDAAAVLLGVNRLLGDPLGEADLLALARPIGADVSFFIHGGPTRVSGIGDRLEPAPDGPREPFVIAKPACGVSTADAYRALDDLPKRRSARAARAWPAGGMANDFEAAIYEMVPEIASLRQRLLDAGAASVLLCGSGSCLAAFSPAPMALWETMRRAGVADVWVVRPWYDNPQSRIRQQWS